MQKIDRLGWAAGVSLIVHGLRVGIRVDDPRLLPTIIPLLPPGYSFSAEPLVERLYSLKGAASVAHHIRPFHLLYAGAQRLARSLHLAEVLTALELDLQFYVASMARRGLFVHAGVVTYGGRAIVVPGRSCTGKTSLVAELVRAGATYYSDEFAIVDGHGRIRPYAKELSIREGPAGKPKKYPVTALGGQAGARAVRAGLIVVSRYRPGARWRPRRLTKGQGTLALLDNTVSVRRQPRLALPRLVRATASAVILKGVRGEARETARSLVEMLAG